MAVDIAMLRDRHSATVVLDGVTVCRGCEETWPEGFKYSLHIALDRIAALEAENERLRTTLRETQEQAHATIGLLKDRLAGRETLEAALAERDRENGDLKGLLRTWIDYAVTGGAADSRCADPTCPENSLIDRTRAALGEAG